MDALNHKETKMIIIDWYTNEHPILQNHTYNYSKTDISYVEWFLLLPFHDQFDIQNNILSLVKRYNGQWRLLWL